MLIPTRIGPKGKPIPRDRGWAAPEYLPADADVAEPPIGWELQGKRLDNHVVIDCDILSAGPAWAVISGVDTYVVRTPHGLHFYYEGTIERKVVRQFPGIDVLGTSKAYVNCPPTPGYSVLLDNPAAQFDPGMLDRFADFVSNVPVIGSDAIESGSRNDTLYRIAAAYRGQGDTAEEISAKLTYINETRCSPPSPQSEIASIATRVAEQYAPNPQVDLDTADDGNYDVLAGTRHTNNEDIAIYDEHASSEDIAAALMPKPSDVIKAARQIGTAEAARQLIAERNAATAPPLTFLDYTGLCDLDPPVWAIDGVLPATGVGQVFGQSYTGKSFVALDMALRIANGEPEWFGKRVVRSGPVFYCLLEGLSDWRQRIDAWLDGHPRANATKLFTLPEQPVNLADEHSIEKVVTAISLTEESPALVVFDTQSLATPGTDENSNTEMNLVMGNMKRLSQKLGCPIMLVHHTGYDQSHARGATSVHAACDYQIQVRSNELMVTKVKAAKPTKWLAFDLVETQGSAYALQRAGECDENGVAQVAVGDGQRILELLWAAGDEPVTYTNIRDALGDTRSFRKAWAELEQSGDIKRVTFNKTEMGRTRRHEGWKTWSVELEGPIEWIDISGPKELDSGH